MTVVKGRRETELKLADTDPAGIDVRLLRLFGLWEMQGTTRNFRRPVKGE